MKIYINSNYEIKAINSTNDETLKEIEVDRELAFGNKSDFMILNYCYEPSEFGYSVYPAKDYSTLELLDKTENKISILENENLLLKESLKLVLAGDMYSLAKVLYPEDFEGVCELK